MPWSETFKVDTSCFGNLMIIQRHSDVFLLTIHKTDLFQDRVGKVTIKLLDGTEANMIHCLKFKDSTLSSKLQCLPPQKKPNSMSRLSMGVDIGLSMYEDSAQKKINL